jgi:cell division protein FtsQ
MDAEACPREVLAEEEPRYLRRQKPLEIKRRKFGRKAWMTYLRVAGWIAVGLAGAWTVYACGHFLYSSPQMALIHPEQVDLSGIHYVARARVLEIFAADRGHSVLRIPLDARRQQLEAIPWVEQAVVLRALPSRLQIQITERTPVAFLRQGSELALVDGHGVILDRPLKANFHFPVVTGVSADMTREDREHRMQLYTSFAQQIASSRTGAMEQISEVDLSDANDLRATVTGLSGSSFAGADAAHADAPLLVRFGDSDFEGKYRALVENIGQWRATAGRVESVDLRFSREAVVNPEAAVVAQQAPNQTSPQSPPASHVPAPAHKSSAPRKPAKKAAKHMRARGLALSS